jgi:hypothetical protein
MLAALASPAFAEDIVAYEAEGDAPAAGADPRVAALDDAFAHAVTAALADVVAPDVRAARKADLDREIVAHARLWVAKFTVTRDETDDARRQLSVSVKIDRDKLRTRLGELDIPTVEPGASPSAGPAKTAAVLVRTTSAGGTRSDLGVAALTTALRGDGFVVRKAPAGPEGEIDDATAAQLAEQAKADIALVGSVSVGALVPVRGQPQPAALVTAKLRMLDKGKPVGQGTAISAARGEDTIGYAVDRALVAAMSDVLPPAPQKLAQAGSFNGDDTPIAEPGVVLVRLPSKTPFAMVLEEQRYLAGAKGVRSASLRRMSPAGWVIGVATDQSTEHVASIAKKPPATDTSAAVKIVGDVVEVTLSGAP